MSSSGVPQDSGPESGAVNVTRTSFLLTAVSLFAKPVGMVKEVFVASLFGATATMDAFYIAISIPNTINSLLSGVFLGGFSPLFIRRSAQERRATFGQALTIVVLLAVVIGSAIYLLREQLPRWLAPGLSVGAMQTAAGLLAVLVIYLVVLLIAEFHRATLNALGRFLLASLLPALNSVAVIVVLWMSARTIQDLGWAIGASTMAVVAVFAGTRMGFSPATMRPGLDQVRPIASQIPFLLGSAILLQVNGVVDKAMASGLGEGSISALGYSYRLLMLLQMVFVHPLEGMLLAFMSTDVAKGKWRRLVKRVNSAIDTAILLVSPVVAFCLLFRAELIRILFERGQFDDAATLATGNAFAAYAPTVLVLSATLALPRYFNAVAKNGWLTLQTAAAVLLNVGLNWLFMRWWGHTGIALSTLVTITLGRLFLFFVAQRDLPAGHRLAMLRPLGTLGLAGIAALITWALRSPIGVHQLHPYLQPVAGLALTVGCFAVVYGATRRHDFVTLVAKLRGQDA